MSPPRDVLLGIAIEPVEHEPGEFRLSDARDPDLRFARGSLPHCERERLRLLEDRFGTPRQNLISRTLGGKQLWSDVFHHAGWRIQEGLSGGHCRLLDTSDKRRAWGSYQECRVAFERARLTQGLRPRAQHGVVLLHGLIRAKDSMRALARAMADAGYEVIDINYPSTRRNVEDFADQVRLVLDRARGIDTVSFVTHSLGGIVVRALLAEADASWRTRLEVHRVLMIFPPNNGAAIADKWRDHPVAKAVMGPVLEELSREAPLPWPPPDCPFAIIAGARDRTVSIDEAWLPEAEQVQLLDVEHTFGMSDPTVVRAAVRYVNSGSLGDPG